MSDQRLSYVNYMSYDHVNYDCISNLIVPRKNKSFFPVLD